MSLLSHNHHQEATSFAAGVMRFKEESEKEKLEASIVWNLLIVLAFDKI